MFKSVKNDYFHHPKCENNVPEQDEGIVVTGDAMNYIHHCGRIQEDKLFKCAHKIIIILLLLYFVYKTRAKGGGVGGVYGIGEGVR